MPLLGYPAAGYLWTLAMTFTGQLIGHSLVAFCLAHLPATLVSMSSQAVVVLSAVLGFLVFNETPGPLQILASGVILSGVIVTILHRPGKGVGWLRH
jgi:drug/metabolite transporter (DMT)-like permease